MLVDGAYKTTGALLLRDDAQARATRHYDAGGKSSMTLNDSLSRLHHSNKA